MAHPVLLPGSQLREAPPERWVEKERVVAEAALAAECLEQHALDDTFDRGLPSATRAHDGDEAPESGAAPLPRPAGHLGQHDLAALRIREVGTAVAGREHAGAATQGIDLDARIVGERELTRGRGGGARLAARVVGVRGVAFWRELDAGEVGQAQDA